jgi:hypothetical protein
MSNPKFFCDKCNCKCRDATDWEKHKKTKKHNSDGTRPKFECNLCDYSCNIVSVFDKHKSTYKHKIRQLEFDKSNECAAQEQSKDYKPIASDSDIMTVVKQLLSQNNELKNFIIEQASEHKKETTEIVNKVIEQTNKVLDTVKPSNTITANTINNNNQKFNINVYLNEQCKDAINFSDFIKNLEVSREDLENNAQLGFVGGVSKILIDSLKQLDKTERPIHCTDVKRETMYIKDEDKWNKQDDSTKLNKAIQEVTRKSMGTLMNWKEENPDYKDRDSEFSERCIVIQQQSMAAHNRDTYYPKVVKAIAKEVTIST